MSSVALPHGAVGYNLKCVTTVYPDHTHLLFVEIVSFIQDSRKRVILNSSKHIPSLPIHGSDD